MHLVGHLRIAIWWTLHTTSNCPINLFVGCERNTEDLTIFHLAFGNMGILNTKKEHHPLRSHFQHSPLEATGFPDEQYSSFITTRKSLQCVDTPIVGPLPERYKSGVYPRRYFFKVHFCVILLSKHFFPKWFLPFRSSGWNLLRISHIYVFATSPGHVIIINFVLLTRI